MVTEELETAQARFDALLARTERGSLSLGAEEISAPTLKGDLAELPKMIEHHSRHILEAKAALEESDANQSLARLSYAPDFMVSYRRAIGGYLDQNAYSASVEMTIPLWFFGRQSGEVSAASARALEAEKRLQATTLDHVSQVKSLTSKVQSNRKILDIYKTGLIPQAESTLGSSRASYRAGRSSFVELLDSERSLYGVRIAYYRSLADYAAEIAKLEEIVGESISTLPFGDSL